ncbi:MAG: hypothetical protein HY277_01840, partial [Ignavibacteriales bacterium]|nr:hypothetical protein [Ignavibacteriales bacterium]
MHIQTIVLLIFCAWTVRAQVQQFPFTENFDSVTVPSLPPGWSTTTNRSPSGDFATTKSTPHSDSTAVISTNATITQNLISPRLDFSTKEADSLKFYERRSSSHNSGVIIEASVDAGATFPIVISDTLKNPGVTSYILRVLRLPPTLSNQTRCRIRWRVIGNGTGTSGTLRFDDIIITALAHIDAEVIAVRFSPNLPVTGDSVFVQATVRNAGTQTIQNIPVEFYDDINNNNLPEPSELIFSMTMTVSLQPGDTAIAETKLSNLTFGKKHLIVRTALAQDQNPLNNQRSATLSVGVPRFTIVVNEIM